MGTVSVLKMDIKGIGFPIPQEKREGNCGKHSPIYIKGVSSRVQSGKEEVNRFQREKDTPLQLHLPKV